MRPSNEVAQFLGNWKAELDTRWNGDRLTSLDEPGLMICIYDYKDRLTINHSLPRELLDHRPYTSHLLSISVSANRPPEAIAKEITRRLLPEARKILHESVIRKDASDDYNQQVIDTTQQIAKSLKTDYNPDPSRGKPIGSIYAYINKSRIEARCDPYNVELKLYSLPLNLAVEICTLLETRLSNLEKGV